MRRPPLDATRMFVSSRSYVHTYVRRRVALESTKGEPAALWTVTVFYILKAFFIQLLLHQRLQWSSFTRLIILLRGERNAPELQEKPHLALCLQLPAQTRKFASVAESLFSVFTPRLKFTVDSAAAAFRPPALSSLRKVGQTTTAGEL